MTLWLSIWRGGGESFVTINMLCNLLFLIGLFSALTLLVGQQEGHLAFQWPVKTE